MEICKCDSGIQKGFENSSTKSSTSFVDMRCMQNNGKKLKCRLMTELSQKKWLTDVQHGLLMYNMGLDKKRSTQLQETWSFMKW